MQEYNRSADHLSRLAVHAGLPPENGPGSRLSPRQWGELIWHSPATYNSSMPQSILASGQQRLIAAELVTAIALYQADHGNNPPARLDDLVPDYLEAVPLDPYYGRPFEYRISTGELVHSPTERQPIELAPGQALVWSKDHSFFLPAPIWRKGAANRLK
jgi:hypothetical protein